MQGLHGICIDAVNPAGAMSRAWLQDLGVSLVRQVARPEPEFAVYQEQELAGSGIASAFVFTSQSFVTNDWAAEAIAYCQKYQPVIAVIENEMDAYLDGREHDASIPRTPAEYREIWNLIAPGLAETVPTVNLCIGGQMFWSGDLAGVWLQELLNGGPLVGARMVDVHCYQMEYGRPDTMNLVQESMALYRTFGFIPVCLEWTVPDEDVINVARFFRKGGAAASTWFGASDGMARGHGVVDDQWAPYPTFYALKAGFMPASYAGVD